jgi:hypothetical protein
VSCISMAVNSRSGRLFHVVLCIAVEVHGLNEGLLIWLMKRGCLLCDDILVLFLLCCSV